MTELTAQDKAELLRDARTYLESYGWDQEYLHNPTRDRGGRLSMAGALMLAASGDYFWRSRDGRQCAILKFAAEELVRQEPSLAKVRSTDRARDLRIIARWEDTHGRTQEQVMGFLTALADSTWKPQPVRRRTFGTEARAHRSAEEFREGGLDEWYGAPEAALSRAGGRSPQEPGYGDLTLAVRLREEIRAASRRPVIRLMEPGDQEFTRIDPAH